MGDCGQSCAAADAHQHAFLRGAAAGHFAGGFGFYLDHAVEQLGVQVFRDKACANALDGVGRGRAAGNDRALRGLDREHFQARPFGLEHLRHAGDMAASAHAGDDGVQALGEVGQNFQRGGAGVDFHIGRIFKLLWHPGAGRGIDQFLGAGDGAFHAFFARRQVKAGAIGQHQAATLDGHAVGHHQNQFVAFDGCHHGQADARIA